MRRPNRAVTHATDVLHSDAVPRHRPSDDQLARINVTNSQSASIFTTSIAMMKAKFFRAKGTSADGLLTKANDVLKNVRVMAAGIRGVGTPLHQIPSGRCLTDTRNEFILKNWNGMKGTIYSPSNNDDELMADVPDGWWLLNPTTNLLLFSCTGAILMSSPIQRLSPLDQRMRFFRKTVKKRRSKGETGIVLSNIMQRDLSVRRNRCSSRRQS